MLKTAEHIISQIDKLPVFPSAAIQVVHLCSDKEISIQQLVKIISLDQSLTSQILRVANSSYFNYPREIHSLDRAVVILGTNLLRDISISFSIFTLYKQFRKIPKAIIAELWRHALLTGFTMKVLADSYSPKQKDLLYIGGLLHDIGKIIYLQVFNEEYLLVLEKSREDDRRLEDLESRYFGVSHSQIGAQLLNKWRLPSSIESMVQFHHAPALYRQPSQEAVWVRLLYLGNLLTHLVEHNENQLVDLIHFDPLFQKYFNFTDTEILQLINTIKSEYNEQREYIKIFEK
ncbi:MAG: HDOD domain-containing protein [Calditrichia bacterium]